MINELIKQGYKYLVVPKSVSTKIYATKMEMTENDFKDSDEFDEFTATNDYEKAIIKVFPKNTFIKLV